MRRCRQRIQVLTETLEQPNPDDSFRSFSEQVLEDIIVGGYGAMELRLTGDGQKPLALYAVDGATIQMRADWNGDPNTVRYVQMISPWGSGQQIELKDNELSYIRLNPRSYTPFGLGRLEVAFETIHEFLGAHRFAAKLASNSVVQYALWMQDLDPGQHERLIRWWQDDIEGTGRVPIMTAENKPEVLRFGAGTDADLRLAWQEFLIRVIASAFDLPPLFLGVEADVNRSTAQELSDLAFRTAVVPTARLLAEHITRDAIAKRLGWGDLEFAFLDVDATDPMEQAQIDQILLGCGVLTVNEARAARGWQPLSDTGAGNAMRMQWEAMALAMPEVDGHPNRRGFRGVLTLADAPSDRAPSGARGHRVMLTAQATERALPSLLGMGVDYAPELDRHDAQRKVGIITAADLRPTAGKVRRLDVSGYCSNATFPRWWTRWRGARVNWA